MTLFEIKEACFSKSALPNRSLAIEQFFHTSPSKSIGKRMSINQSTGITFNQCMDNIVSISSNNKRDDICPQMQKLALETKPNPVDVERLRT